MDTGPQKPSRRFAQLLITKHRKLIALRAYALAAAAAYSIAFFVRFEFSWYSGLSATLRSAWRSGVGGTLV